MTQSSLSRRRILAAGMACVAAPVLAQPMFPSQPIKVIVPYPPGGVTNAMIHMLAPLMARRLGQPVVVENRAGAAANIGTAAVAQASADGHTLLFTTDVLGKNQSVYKNAGYDAQKDFEPIGMIGGSPFVLLANHAFPANDLPSLVAMAKAQPGTITYASLGAGSNLHLATTLFQNAAEIRLMHIPYKGGGPAITDLLGGHVQLMFTTVTSALPLLAGKRAKAIALAASSRVPQLPGVATFAEHGYSSFNVDFWLAMLAPAKTPAATLAKLQDALQAAVAEPEFAKKASELGFVVRFRAPAEFRRYLTSELDRWGRLVRKENISADE